MRDRGRSERRRFGCRHRAKGSAGDRHFAGSMHACPGRDLGRAGAIAFRLDSNLGCLSRPSGNRGSIWRKSGPCPGASPRNELACATRVHTTLPGCGQSAPRGPLPFALRDGGGSAPRAPSHRAHDGRCGHGDRTSHASCRRSAVSSGIGAHGIRSSPAGQFSRAGRNSSRRSSCGRLSSAYRFSGRYRVTYGDGPTASLVITSANPTSNVGNRRISPSSACSRAFEQRLLNAIESATFVSKVGGGAPTSSARRS